MREPGEGDGLLARVASASGPKIPQVARKILEERTRVSGIGRMEAGYGNGTQAASFGACESRPTTGVRNMGWMLVVSEDETFQREAILRVRGRQPVVGATGDSSARGLVRAVDVQTILVDALDDVGRRFLT